ncbi:MAG: 6-carboxytetrahydropterin synthase [Acidobacteria bacterium]|nr:6-carboxytetrahydropterin synthase [Acidobacteriota bacterium]
MYTVMVREHVMIAHSFQGAVFGPAQQLHGATYVVDVEFKRPDVDADGIVVDIGRAGETLKRILGEINFRNLDEVPAFHGRNTTTEFLARWVFGQVTTAIAAGDLGPGGRDLHALRITLHESHVASASFEGPVRID